MEEELIVKAKVSSQEQGVELLTCLQAIVNSFGAEGVIKAVNLMKNQR